MNLEWLETFTIIAEEKSITQAAEKLHVSQPALSKQLKNLENKFDVPLVYRSAKGITVTEAGDCLYKKAKNLLFQAAAIEQEMHTFARSKNLRVGCLPSLATSYLPTMHFNEHSIFIQNGSETLVDSLGNNQIDIALIDNTFSNEKFNKETLFTEEYIVIAPKSYQLGHNKGLTWQEIQSFPMILHAAPCDSNSRILSYVKQSGNDINLVKTVPFGDFLYGYVLAKEGLTIVPKLIAKNLRHLDVDQIPIPELKRTIVVTAKSQQPIDQFFNH